jgi:hypothetical protein
MNCYPEREQVFRVSETPVKSKDPGQASSNGYLKRRSDDAPKEQL